jgi:hypothetical protein
MGYRWQLLGAGIAPDPRDPNPPPMNPATARTDRARRDRQPGRRAAAPIDGTGDILG